MAELYRTKMDHFPVEANRLDAVNAVAISLWCKGVHVKEHDALQHEITFEAINVPTPAGMKRAQEGDWVVRYENGKYDVAKAHEFDDIFEAVIDG